MLMCEAGVMYLASFTGEGVRGGLILSGVGRSGVWLWLWLFLY
jgi:hypothetical protein